MPSYFWKHPDFVDRLSALPYHRDSLLKVPIQTEREDELLSDPMDFPVMTWKDLDQNSPEFPDARGGLRFLLVILFLDWTISRVEDLGQTSVMRFPAMSKKLGVERRMR